MKPLIVLSSVWLSLIGAPQSMSQSAATKAAPVTFEGQFSMGAPPPASEGMFTTGERGVTTAESITVWTVRSITNVTQCGETRTAAGGHYRVSVRDVPSCTNAGNGGKSVTYVFAWNGEQVGLKQISVDPKVFSTWNQTYNIDLFLGSGRSTVRPAPQSTLLLRRFHGKVLINGKGAPAGNVVALFMDQAGGRVKCGEGRTGDGGFYILDVPRDVHCESSSRVRYEFMYKDQPAGAIDANIPPDPAQLGIPVGIDLNIKAG